MTRKRKIKLGLFTLVGVLASSCLLSCGENVTTSSPTTTTTSGSDEIEVVMWHTFGQAIQDQLARNITKFQNLVKENEGVNVKISPVYQGSYVDILSKIERGYSTGNTPTISVAYPDHVAEYLTFSDNFVVNMQDYIDDSTLTFGTDTYLGDDIAGTDDFVQSFINEGTNYAKEGLYSIPLQKSTELMFYNQVIVEKLVNDSKLKQPGESVSHFMNNLSWENFMALNRIVKADMDNNKGQLYGTALKAPAVYDSDSNLFITQLYQRDIDFLGIDEAGQGKLLFAEEPALTNAMNFVTELKEQFTDGLIWTKGTQNSYGSDSFKNGEVLFSIGSSGGSGYQDPGVSFTAGVCPVPSYSATKKQYISQGPTLAMLNNVALSQAKNQLATKYAWKFIKYLTSTETNVELCLSSSGYVPVRTSCYETEDYSAYLNEQDLDARAAKVVYSTIGDNYFNTSIFKGTATARIQVGGIVTNVLQGKKDVPTAFEEAINQIRLAM